MATTTVTPNLQVVPFPQPGEQLQPLITQAELAYITTLRQQLDEVKSRLSEAEARVKDALAADTPVQPGLLRATLKTIERRTVAWKDVVVRKLGEAYANRVLAATKPTPSTRLIVST